MSGNSLAMMPWFPRDFIAATRHLALAERGAYRELLDYQWEMGTLPKDHVRLARLLAITLDEFEGIWPAISDKFEDTDSGITNKRLEEHRKKATEQRDKKINGAAKTNAKRYAERPECDTLSESLCESLTASPPSPSPSPSQLREREEKNPPTPKGGVQRVFDHWRIEFDHPNAELSVKRKRRIVEALKTRTPEQVCNAVSGYKHSAFHMGQNKDGKIFDDIELFLRSVEHIEEGERFFAHPPRPPPKPEPLSVVDRVRMANGLGRNDERVVAEQNGSSGIALDDFAGDVWPASGPGLRRIGP